MSSETQSTRSHAKKPKVFVFIFAFLCVSVFFLSRAQAEAQDRFLAIQQVTSKGGITAWLVEDHTLPIIAMEFTFKGAGAAQDPVDRQGLSQMASNTMDEGAGTRDGQAFQKALADHSIALRFRNGRDDFGGALKTLTRTKALAFELTHDALTVPRFDEEAIGRMRAANLARLRSGMADPNWMAARLLNDVAYAGHPYARNSGGTLTTLAAITQEDLKTFAAMRLTRDRLLVTVTGDIAARDLGPVLDQIFGGLPAKSSLPVPADITVQNGGQTILFEKDIPQTMIEILQPSTIERKDADWPAFQVMNMIFGGGGFGSRLMEEVREKRGLTYGIYSNAVLFDHVKGFSVSSSSENASAAQVIALTREEMEKIRKIPVTEKEAAEARDYLTGSMALALTSTGGIARIMMGLRSDGLPIDYLDHIKERINAVTVADVQRVAQEVLAPDRLTIVLVGKPAGVTPTKIVTTIPNVE